MNETNVKQATVRWFVKPGAQISKAGAEFMPPGAEFMPPGAQY